MYGKIDMDALRERGVAAAAVAEAATPGEEEGTSGGELASNTCTWPPPEAEYFFGENTWLGKARKCKASRDVGGSNMKLESKHGMQYSRL